MPNTKSDVGEVVESQRLEIEKLRTEFDQELGAVRRGKSQFQYFIDQVERSKNPALTEQIERIKKNRLGQSN